MDVLDRQATMNASGHVQTQLSEQDITYQHFNILVS